MEKKFNYTYQIKNLINGKTYIGVHSTNDLNDGYMGSGLQLPPAYEKYGKENFVKTIMCFFDTSDEAYEEEKFLVNEEWVKRRDTYNSKLGGRVSNHTEEIKQKISNTLKGKYPKGQHPNNGIIFSDEHKDNMKKNHADFIGDNNPKHKNKKTGLPLYIRKTKNKKNPFNVLVKKTYVGIFPTVEEAIIARDNYINNNKNT